MAVQSARRGPSGVVYALLFFVFLSLTGLGLAILFYTQLEEAKVKADDAETRIEQFVRSNEINQPGLNEVLTAASQRTPPVSAYTEMQVRLQRLKALISGATDTSMYDIEKQLNEVGVSDGKTVVSEVSTVRKELDDLAKVNTEADARIKQAQTELADLKKAYDALDAERQKKAADLEARIAKYEQDATTYEQQVKTATDTLAADLKAAQDKAAADIRQRDNEIKGLNSQISKLELRIKELISLTQKEKPDAPDLARQPDGKIISVSPESDLVYLDLGQGDHLVLGTTFEVFDAERGIEVDADNNLRGKASIEVIDVGETSSSARIVRGSLARPVVPGDLIANLVYDKTRVFKFFVFGDFDLDGDGEPSLADHDLVVSLIRKWGGEVVDAKNRERGLSALLGKEDAGELLLPLDTDYLIIGSEPEVPAPLPPGGVDPRELAKAAAAKQKWETFLKLRQEAGVLSVPMMNQHRFLSLVGYYR